MESTLYLTFCSGISSGPGIICGTVWGSFGVRGSFADRHHLRACTVMSSLFALRYTEKGWQLPIIAQYIRTTPCITWKLISFPIFPWHKFHCRGSFAALYRTDCNACLTLTIRKILSHSLINIDLLWECGVTYGVLDLEHTMVQWRWQEIICITKYVRWTFL